MPGVKSDVITHRLSVYTEARPIAQKKKKLGEERRKAAREETDKLIKLVLFRRPTIQRG